MEFYDGYSAHQAEQSRPSEHAVASFMQHCYPDCYPAERVIETRRWHPPFGLGFHGLRRTPCEGALWRRRTPGEVHVYHRTEYVACIRLRKNIPRTWWYLDSAAVTGGGARF